MHDFIRSPLQFTQPMTSQEWEELVSRANHRELQREKRRMMQRKAAPAAVVTRKHVLDRRLNRSEFDPAAVS